MHVYVIIKQPNNAFIIVSKLLCLEKDNEMAFYEIVLTTTSEGNIFS